MKSTSVPPDLAMRLMGHEGYFTDHIRGATDVTRASKRSDLGLNT